MEIIVELNLLGVLFEWGGVFTVCFILSEIKQG